MEYVPLDIKHIKWKQIVYKQYMGEYFICRISRVNKEEQTYNMKFLGSKEIKFQGKNAKISSLFRTDHIPFTDGTVFYIPKAEKSNYDGYWTIAGKIIKSACYWYWQEYSSDKSIQTSIRNEYIARAKAFFKNDRFFAIMGLDREYLLSHSKMLIDKGMFLRKGESEV